MQNVWRVMSKFYLRSNLAKCKQTFSAERALVGGIVMDNREPSEAREKQGTAYTGKDFAP